MFILVSAVRIVFDFRFMFKINFVYNMFDMDFIIKSILKKDYFV